MSSEQYDLVIIGSGPGGYRAAIEAGRRRAKTAIIEQAELGGTCVNWGCIPTKSILAASETLNRLNAILPGSDHADMTLSGWDRAQAYKTAQVGRLQSGLEEMFRQTRIRVIRGRGVLTSPHTVRVNGEDVHGKAILLAAGSIATQIPNFPFDGQRIVSSHHILSMETLPRSMIVLGGGVLGCEFANWLNDFGVEVTILEMSDQLLPQFDLQISRALRRAFKQRGILVKTKSRADHYVNTNTGIKIVLANGNEYEADKLLVAVGRKPRLDPEVIGPVELVTKDGRAVVNEHFQTSVPSVYAVGDLIGGEMLAHTAEIQGEFAARHALGEKSAWHNPPIPACVFTNPGVSMVGFTERGAIDAGHDIKVGMAYYLSNGRGIASNQTAGLAKIIAETDSGKILGAHVCGASATEVIASMSVALSLGATVEQLADIVWAHPTYSEVLAEAARACVHSAHN